MKLVIFIFFTSWSIANCQSTGNSKGMIILGSGSAIANPCPENYFFSMEAESGRPPATENYWDGIINVKDFTNSYEADIEFTLDNPAVVTPLPKYFGNSNIKYIKANGTTFQMKISNTWISAYFTVQGYQGKGFPNVVKFTLNGEEICKNPKKVKPFFQEGARPMAYSGIDTDSTDFISFCGRSKKIHSELILNAKQTKPGDWPWHVALYSINAKNNSARSYRCGGSIISHKSIVTAAHCVIGSNRSNISVDQLLVIAGKYNLYEKDPTIQELRVSNVVINSEFSPNTLRNDIAVVQLKDNIDFNEYVQPICLWNDNDSSKSTSKQFIYGLNGTVVGWGLNENDTLSQRLGYGEIPVISDYTCIMSFPAFFQLFVNEKTFCAGNINGTNPCNGDSGGGLVMAIRQPDNKFSYFLRGIVSVSVSRIRFGKRVCDPNYYSVFTDAAQYTNWLNENKFAYYKKK